MKNKLIVTLFLLVLSSVCHGFQSFKVTIYLPKDYTNKCIISYKIKDREIVAKNTGNKVLISDTLFAQYAVIRISFSDKKGNETSTDHFWVNEQQAQIIFSNKTTTKNTINLTANPELDVKLVNARNQMFEGEKDYRNFVAKEHHDFEVFSKENERSLEENDSVTLVHYLEKRHKVYQKAFQYIQNNKNSYYSFLLFKDFLVYSDCEPASLKDLFQKSFSEEIKASYDGIKIQNFLNAKSLTVGSKAPNFILLDINGVKTTIDTNKNVLLVFWATWCKPCIDEVPALNEISAKFPEEKLEIIFVSLDKNKEIVKAAIKKYKMGRINVLSNKDILDKYITGGIPDVFLIKKGEIIYRRDEENFNNIEKLPKLNVMLNELINNN